MITIALVVVAFASGGLAMLVALVLLARGEDKRRDDFFCVDESWMTRATPDELASYVTQLKRKNHDALSRSDGQKI